ALGGRGEAARARAPRLGGRARRRVLDPLASGTVRRAERAWVGPAVLRADRRRARSGWDLPRRRGAGGDRSGTLRAPARLVDRPTCRLEIASREEEAVSVVPDTALVPQRDEVEESAHPQVPLQLLPLA